MSQIMLVEDGPHETRVAILEDDRLAEIHLESGAGGQAVGSIFKGKVKRVLEGMDAAFVDIGRTRDAYLFTGDPEPRWAGPQDQPEGAEGIAARPAETSGDSDRREPSTPARPIVGQEIVVQVVKASRRNKGARISSRISLPGRFVVLLPGGRQLGVSRRIVEAEERERLQSVLTEVRADDMGVIVRTAAAGIDADRLQREYRSLLGRWQAIHEAAGRIAAPALLAAEEGLSARLVRDLLSDDFDAVWVEGREACDRLRRFVERIAPDLASRVRLHEGLELLFDRFGVEEQIERALRSRVWLKSGGTLVIHPTEALVAIDVNTGRYIGRDSLEDTVVRTNLEAVVEIVRQVRLRDLSGILVIDFIDMIEDANRERVMEALERELEKDRSRSRVLRISEFGLVELTRKRTRPNLQSRMTEPCARCGGSGRVATPAATCGRLRRELLRRHRSGRTGPTEIRAHAAIVEALEGPQGAVLEEMQELWGGQLRLAATAELAPGEFQVQRGSAAPASPGRPGKGR